MLFGLDQNQALQISSIFKTEVILKKNDIWLKENTVCVFKSNRSISTSPVTCYLLSRLTDQPDLIRIQNFKFIFAEANDIFLLEFS